jgi:hypothetical protein
VKGVEYLVSERTTSANGPTVETSPGDVWEDLRASYDLGDDKSIDAFLSSRRFLVPLLRAVREKVREYFGEDARVLLELRADPEASAPLEELFAYILTPLPTLEAFGRLDRLAFDWWLDAMGEARGELTLSIGAV